MFTNREFEPFQGELEIILNIKVADKHVSKIEHRNQVIKERFRLGYSYIQHFNTLPHNIIIKLVRQVVM